MEVGTEFRFERTEVFETFRAYIVLPSVKFLIPQADYEGCLVNLSNVADLICVLFGGVGELVFDTFPLHKIVNIETTIGSIRGSSLEHCHLIG